jgi:hypothetical protein
MVIPESCHDCWLWAYEMMVIPESCHDRCLWAYEMIVIPESCHDRCLWAYEMTKLDIYIFIIYFRYGAVVVVIVWYLDFQLPMQSVYTFDTGPLWSWLYGTWIYSYLYNQYILSIRGRCGRDCRHLDLQLPIQAVHVTTKEWVRIPFMARYTRYNVIR